MSMDLIDRVKALREAGMVERCHVLPHVKDYTNARHTWGVCCLLRLLWPEAPHLIDVALFHDVPERWTGDLPAHVIRRNPAIKDTLREEDEAIMSVLKLPSEHVLTDVDYARFKAADRLDFWLWTFEEEALGNRMVLNARYEIEAHISHDPNTPPEVLAFMDDYLERGWSRHKETM